MEFNVSVNYPKSLVRRNDQRGHRQSEDAPPAVPDEISIRKGFPIGKSLIDDDKV
jgi:hypothetical protein